jgi:hypothetical protein
MIYGETNMRLLRMFLAAALLVGVTSCRAGADPAKSMQGLFSATDCEAVPELLGNWSSPGQPDNIIREAHDHKYWVIEAHESSKTGDKIALEMCFAHIGGRIVFDAIVQVLRAGDQPTLPPVAVVGNAFPVNALAGLWLPVHFLGSLEIQQNALHIRYLDDQWLQVAAKAGAVPVTTAQSDSGNYFLTAPTKELKTFVAGAVTQPKAFADLEDWARSPDKKAVAPH